MDKTTYDCGTLIEGKKEKISPVFVISNTGDAPLKIKNVRPSCGCTVVEYDTIILPGKTGEIKPEVNLKGFSGKIKKSVTVTSNAEDNPNLRLLIEAQIQPIISVSERYLAMKASNDTNSKEIVLSTLKKDLKVESVSFKAFRQNGPTWQKDIPMTLRYDFSSLDSTTEDDFKAYKLTLFASKTEESLNGEFIIDTNHPDKHEIKLRGRIDK